MGARRAETDAVRQSGLARTAIIVAVVLGLIGVSVAILAWQRPKKAPSTPVIAASYRRLATSGTSCHRRHPKFPRHLLLKPMAQSGVRSGSLGFKQTTLTSVARGTRSSFVRRAAAAVTLTRIQPVVENVTSLEHSTEFACLVAGGSNPALAAGLNLDDANAPLAVGANDGADVPIEIPPDSLEVGEGLIGKNTNSPIGNRESRVRVQN